MLERTFECVASTDGSPFAVKVTPTVAFPLTVKLLLAVVDPTTTLSRMDISVARLISFVSTNKVPPTPKLPSTVASFAKRFVIVSTMTVSIKTNPSLTVKLVAL